MDPNANVEEQRRLAARLNDHAQTVACACTRCVADAARLAELVVALDGWLCSGGFLPRTWERK